MKCDNDKINIALQLFTRTYEEARTINMADLVRKSRADEITALEKEKEKEEEKEKTERETDGHLSSLLKV